MPENLREQIARIIDPREWDEAETYRVRADEWFAKGRTEPGDALTDGYRQKADEMQAKLLAKADAILALTPVEGVGMQERCALLADAKFRELTSQYQKPANAAALVAFELAKEIRALSTPVAVQGDVREALEKIDNWEMPETGQFWDKECTQPMSYAACYGSNGERDHIISVARAALATLGAPHEG